MNALARRMERNEAPAQETVLAGMHVVCDPSGTLYAPSDDLLVVSDLHLEKGAAFARRGMLLPPYDTAATLALLEAALVRYRPRSVVCLGDSFHDRTGAALMPAIFREPLQAMMRRRDWIWIAGNHDPEPPTGLGGETHAEIAVGALTLRHEPRPGAVSGEVAGHLHPVAKVSGRGRSVRSACFATDGRRMILPSFGVTTGGLNVLDRAFHGLFEVARAKAYVIGRARIYPIPFAGLCAG
ncbi:ligase-associated DNA damage response endonuclease PdeM [Aurantimonas sp. VKM B-3413]|uniref:ligase-associated DNA damage response endonuclease PdeM n=1 Tax=Aurantimonas sp. VKM B-3413 TaxID=2779401 RepID=UPI001E3D7F60|nr:ligase-associated DNA damage response endonuclease PdeM [Aurantimonas sp. VKM B-3413]MCB8835980.1 ligase-associated DNA damage response endonuclease PdeM [Aurantimonas sp. VKM B-3413]